MKKVRLSRAAGVLAIAISAAMVLMVLPASSGAGASQRSSAKTSSAKTTTLTMWVQTAAPYEKAAQLEAAQYEKLTGVHIELSYVPWADFGAKLTSAFAAGAAPDVIEGVEAWVYAQKVGGELSPVPADIVSEMKSGMDNASVTPMDWQGKYYAVPINVNIDNGPFTLYNIDEFQKAHISPSFSSWNAYVADLQKLTTTANGRITRSGLEMMGGDPETGWMQYFLELGGQFYSKNDKSVQIDNKYGSEALQVMYNLLYKYKVDTVDNTAPVGIASGQAATINYGPWYVAEVKASYPNFKWGWAKAPLLPGSVGPYFPGTNVWCWIVPKSSPNQSAAWKFISWLNEDKQRYVWSNLTGEIMAVKAMWKEPKVANDPRWAPWLPYLKYQVPVAYIGPQDTYTTVLTNMVDSVMLKSVKIPQALKSAQSQLNTMLAGISSH